MVHRLLFSFILALSPALASAHPIQHHGVPQLDQPVASPYSAEAATMQGLKLVIPAGWTLHAHPEDLPETLTWAKSDKWVALLQGLSDKTGLKVSIDWDRKVVDIGAGFVPVEAPKPPEPKPVEAPAPKEVPPVPATVAESPAKRTGAAAVSATAQPWLLVEPEHKADGAGSSALWSASADSGLHAVLERWAAKAGWQLYWGVAGDLQLLTGFEHHGDFQPAVQAVLSGIRQSGGPDIRAVFYAGNHVLRVYTPAP